MLKKCLILLSIICPSAFAINVVDRPTTYQPSNGPPPSGGHDTQGNLTQKKNSEDAFAKLNWSVGAVRSGKVAMVDVHKSIFENGFSGVDYKRLHADLAYEKQILDKTREIYNDQWKHWNREIDNSALSEAGQEAVRTLNEMVDQYEDDALTVAGRDQMRERQEENNRRWDAERKKRMAAQEKELAAKEAQRVADERQLLNQERIVNSLNGDSRFLLRSGNVTKQIGQPAVDFLLDHINESDHLAYLGSRIPITDDCGNDFGYMNYGKVLVDYAHDSAVGINNFVKGAAAGLYDGFNDTARIGKLIWDNPTLVTNLANNLMSVQWGEVYQDFKDNYTRMLTTLEYGTAYEKGHAGGVFASDLLMTMALREATPAFLGLRVAIEAMELSIIKTGIKDTIWESVAQKALAKFPERYYEKAERYAKIAFRMNKKEAQGLNRSMIFERNQLQQKFSKHAAELGFNEKWNLPNAKKFEAFLMETISDESTMIIDGTFRWNIPAISFYNEKTNILVVKSKEDGRFITCIKPSARQAKQLMEKGDAY